MKKFLTLLLLAVSVMSSYAYDVCIDGIYYNLVPKAKQAQVTSGDVHYAGDIVIPEKITSGGVEYAVTVIGNLAFSSCSSLTSIQIPNSVTSIGDHAFIYCISLTSIQIPNSVTSIGGSAFAGCSSVTSIQIPNSVTSIDRAAFHGCSSLTSIQIPNSVTSIGDDAFAGCSSLSSIQIPNSVTSIGGYAFQDCRSLSSIQIPNSVTSIDRAAFYGCSSLTSIQIPNSVTSIYRDAFYGCENLTNVTLGSGIQELYEKAFANCPNLENVYCNAVNVPSIYSDTFEGSYIEYVNLYVPAESLWAYKNADVWKNFGTITAMGTIPVDSINIDRDSIELYVGDTDTLAVEVFPDYAENKTVSWSSSDDDVVSVDEAGVVTANAGGSAYIYASSTDGSNVVDSCYVLVRVNVDSIKIVADSTLLYVGDTDSLRVVVLPENATYKDVLWSSAKPEIVSVDSIGVITALDYGTAYIYAAATDGSEVVDSCLITVKAEFFELNDSIAYLSEETFPCDTLTYTRNFSNPNWNALYVPFAMNYDDWADDFEVARLNDVHQFDDDEDGVVDRTVLESVKLKEGSSTEPNTPYMIKAKEVGEKTITLTDATLYAAEENSFDVTSWYTKFTFTGTYNTVTDMATAGHYAMAEGGLKQASSDSATLGAFRWYLDITDRNGNPAPLMAKTVLLSFDDGEETAIEVINALPENKGNVYSISGVKVGNDVNALPKGLYIMNGKKILVK